MNQSMHGHAVLGAQEAQPDPAGQPTNGGIDTMTTKTTATMTRTVSGFGPLQIPSTILVAATALVHLFLGPTLTIPPRGPPPQIVAMGDPLAAIVAVLFLSTFAASVVPTAPLSAPAPRRFQRVTRALL